MGMWCSDKGIPRPPFRLPARIRDLACQKVKKGAPPPALEKLGSCRYWELSLLLKGGALISSAPFMPGVCWRANMEVQEVGYDGHWCMADLGNWRLCSVVFWGSLKEYWVGVMCKRLLLCVWVCEWGKGCCALTHSSLFSCSFNKYSLKHCSGIAQVFGCSGPKWVLSPPSPISYSLGRKKE